MSLIRYNYPWNLLNTLQRDLYNPDFRLNDDDASAATASWAPSVDISEDDKAFTLRADIPGVEPKDIDISMEKGVLTIRGERQHSSEESEKGFHRQERQQGVFMRRFSLPDSVNAEAIEAHSKDGVLELVLPKTPAQQPRKIEVRT